MSQIVTDKGVYTRDSREVNETEHEELALASVKSSESFPTCRCTPPRLRESMSSLVLDQPERARLRSCEIAEFLNVACCFFLAAFVLAGMKTD